MSKFKTADKEKAGREQPVPRRPRAIAAARLVAAVLLAVTVALVGPYAWKGSGAAGKEIAAGSGFHLPEIDGGKLASGLQVSIRTIRINAFLAGRQSPLAGMGSTFVDAERETGVSAELIAAITLAESSCATDGALSVTNHNAWGMKGPQPALGIHAEGGYCWWSDWPSAIHGAARFIAYYWGPAKTAGELKGYACGSGSWARTVEGAQQSIK